MKIHVLVVDGAADFGLSAVLDTLNYANQLAATFDPRPAPLEITLIGTRNRIHTANGFEVSVKRFDPSLRPDAIVIPALGALTPEQVESSLERPELRPIKAAIVAKARDDVWIGAACTATFLLAETGLLDGHTATTSWWLAPLFRKRYPRIELDDSRMVVFSAPYVTAGAALAHVDLALGLVRRRSPALAAVTARYLLVDSRSSQAAYAIPDHLAHADPIVEKFEGWARRNLANGFSLSDAAHAVGTSQRTLARRLEHTLGKSPLGFFQELRVEHAIHLLQTGHDSIDQIAEQVGYSDGVTLRSLLRRKLGRSVRDLRTVPYR